MTTRLPSFNDFSPDIVGDIRRPLEILVASPDEETAKQGWANAFFGGKRNKRADTNIPATLVSTGLALRRPMRLTEVGKEVRASPSPKEAARIFCAHVIKNLNGDKLIEAVSNLHKRGEPVTKAGLKRDLKVLGVSDLSNATTDHTTLKNWMVYAGLLRQEGKLVSVDDNALKAAIGVSGTELDELSALGRGQRLFLAQVRRRLLVDKAEFRTSEIIDACLADYPGMFRDDQFRKDIIDPLEAAGWIVTSGSIRAKSGLMQGSSKLESVPLESILPGLETGIPPDLRKHIQKPLPEIKQAIENHGNKAIRGLGLELLALRMIIDLRLNPRGFRKRSRETAYAEVDLIAEGEHLLFSRWTFQCKCTDSRVGLSEVAKEVGIAIYAKAHVIAMVTTSEFSRDAYDYAREVSATTHLQFVFIPGKIVRAYLTTGSKDLVSYVMENARRVMSEKAVQVIKLPDE